MVTAEFQSLKMKYGIVGNSYGLNHALDVALQVAHTDSSVLIIGESGVGKEVIPRIIHDNSARKHGKYFAVNCGSIPEGTIDSELFGHMKGSFTGAIGDHAGYFETANGGTLFLDEVGELPMATQARLLRVLETGEFIRVGSSEVRKTNVRIVAATNVNMNRAIVERRFREDLYYRLNTIPIMLPPLRERKEDIPLLFMKFAGEISEKYNMPPIRIADARAKEVLLGYKWPGNIRQLKNITEQMSLLEKTRELTADILRNYIPQDKETTDLAVVGGGTYDEQHYSYEKDRALLFSMIQVLTQDVNDLKKRLQTMGGQAVEVPTMGALPDKAAPDYLPHSVDEFMDAEEWKADEPTEEPVTELVPSIRDNEKNLITKVLKKYNGRRQPAAEELGISERTLYRKIRQYDIS